MTWRAFHEVWVWERGGSYLVAWPLVCVHPSSSLVCAPRQSSLPPAQPLIRVRCPHLFPLVCVVGLTSESLSRAHPCSALAAAVVALAATSAAVAVAMAAAYITHQLLPLPLSPRRLLLSPSSFSYCRHRPSCCCCGCDCRRCHRLSHSVCGICEVTILLAL